MPKDDHITVKGTVVKANGNGFFTVLSDEADGGATLLCKLSGKIRTNTIKIIEGDAVEVSVGPYDMGRGIITFRTKKQG